MLRISVPVLAAGIAVFAQAPSPDLLQLIDRANALQLKAPPAEVLAICDQAEALARRDGDRRALARLDTIRGFALVRSADYQAAEQRFSDALTTMREQEDRRGIAVASAGLGQVARNFGETGKAIRYLSEALGEMRQVGTKSDVAGSLNNLGIAYRASGNLRKALDCYSEALTLYQELKIAPAIAGMRNNLGNLYLQQGQAQLAEDQFRQSVALARQAGNPVQIAQALSNLGLAQQRGSRPQQALASWTEALRIREEQKDRLGMARTLLNLAALHREAGRLEDAEGELRRALSLADETGNREIRPDVLRTLAAVKGGGAEALRLAEEAVQAARDIAHPDKLWNALTALGNLQAASGRRDDALTSYGEAVEEIERMRWDVAGAESERQRFFADRVEPYHRIVEIHAARGDAAAVFSWAERVKARVLVDALNGARTEVTEKWDAETRAEWRRAHTGLARANVALLSEANGARIPALRRQRDAARLKFEGLRTRLFGARPEWKLRHAELPAATLADAQRLAASSRGAILEYVVTPREAWLLTITGSGASLQRLSASVKALAEAAEGFRRKLADRDLAWAQDAARLHALLLAPVQRTVAGRAQLIVIPDGPLWNVAFQALRPASGKHLIEQHAVAYAPSVTALLAMRTRRAAGSAPSRLTVFANPPSRLPDTPPLPETEALARELPTLYGPASTSVYVGAEATESRFKAAAPEAGTLQFAGHGILRNDAPMYSQLAFAPEGVQDGLLEVWEIVEMSVRAPLVVLTGCETALGEFGAGEGVVGLSWAFAVAGVPATVVTQWKVETAASVDLTMRFHTALRKDALRPAQALRKAVLAAMARDERRHPFYWAGFLVMGDGL